MTAVKVTPAQNKHVLQSAKILAQAYYDSITSARKSIQNKIKTRECFVALRNGSVVGILIYARNFSHYANYIEDIVVSKEERRNEC